MSTWTFHAAPSEYREAGRVRLAVSPSVGLPDGFLMAKDPVFLRSLAQALTSDRFDEWGIASTFIDDLEVRHYFDHDEDRDLGAVLSTSHLYVQIASMDLDRFALGCLDLADRLEEQAKRPEAVTA